MGRRAPEEVLAGRGERRGARTRPDTAPNRPLRLRPAEIELEIQCPRFELADSRMVQVAGDGTIDVPNQQSHDLIVDFSRAYGRGDSLTELLGIEAGALNWLE